MELFESEEADTSAVSSLFGVPALNFLPQFLTFFESNDGEINFVAANEALVILFTSKGKKPNISFLLKIRLICQVLIQKSRTPFML